MKGKQVRGNKKKEKERKGSKRKGKERIKLASSVSSKYVMLTLYGPNNTEVWGIFIPRKSSFLGF